VDRVLPLEILFRPDGSSHDDLLVRLGGFEQIADSYWLAVDNAFKPDREDDAKAREVLEMLLGHWLAHADSLGEGETILLPFNFQDEWIGCFRTTLKQGALELQPGILKEDGYAVNVSAPEEILLHPGAFSPNGEIVRLDKATFRAAVNSARAALHTEQG
jgi:hypothetical protein